MRRVFLLPGRLYTSRDPAEISTCLGPCVAVAMADTSNGVGGMNHFVLPRPREGQATTPRFGSIAIPTLADALVAMGARRDRLAAKIYGGASVLPNSSLGREIGDQNVEMAVETLKSLGIPVWEADTGGNRARRISLRLPSFEVQRELAPKTIGIEGASFDVTGYPEIRAAERVRVGIVDDHEGIRELFRKVFERKGFEVVGTAGDAREAREMIVRERPDVVTLDIEMPGMTGVDFLEKLMQHLPTPVVMVSHLEGKGEEALRALSLGAVEFVQKPNRFDHGAFTRLAEALVDKVRAAATTRFVALSRRRKSPGAVEQTPTRRPSPVRVITIGGNTGSLESLGKLVEAWPASCPPTVVADTSVAPLLDAFLTRHQPKSAARLVVAKASQPLVPGTIYFIPSEREGRVRRVEGELRLALSEDRTDTASPSANGLLSSAAEAAGAGAVGVLLSGFGRDGIEGLEKIMSVQGVAIVLSPEEANFPFTPQQAIADGVFDLSLGLGEICQWVSDSSERKAA